jgi:hypothetical protein
VEYICAKNIKEQHMSPADLVNWLLDSHVHFILSHVHQGIGPYLHWNMKDLENELQRLSNHFGFPKGTKLKCPIFLQDKFEYLQLLPVNKGNQTLQIYLTDDSNFFNGENEDFMANIKRYRTKCVYINIFFMFTTINI